MVKVQTTSIAGATGTDGLDRRNADGNSGARRGLKPHPERLETREQRRGHGLQRAPERSGRSECPVRLRRVADPRQILRSCRDPWCCRRRSTVSAGKPPVSFQVLGWPLEQLTRVTNIILRRHAPIRVSRQDDRVIDGETGPEMLFQAIVEFVEA